MPLLFFIMHFFLPALLLLLCMDTISKYAAKEFLADSIIWICEPVFSLQLAFNTGVAFSFPLPYYGQIGITILFFIGFFWWARKYFYNCSRAEQWGMTLFIAGAIGNFWERVVFRMVTDFISFSTPWFQFPIFNIADAYIFIGVVLWFLGSQNSKERD